MGPLLAAFLAGTLLAPLLPQARAATCTAFTDARTGHSVAFSDARGTLAVTTRGGETFLGRHATFRSEKGRLTATSRSGGLSISLRADMRLGTVLAIVNYRATDAPSRSPRLRPGEDDDPPREIRRSIRVAVGRGEPTEIACPARHVIKPPAAPRGGPAG